MPTRDANDIEFGSDNRLIVNIMHFARTLRAAGLPVGPGTVIRAIEAVEAVGVDSRKDFYWTLHSVFVNRRDQKEIFDQAFHVFWRNPEILKKMMSLLLPTLRQELKQDSKGMNRRLADALDIGKTPESGGQGDSADETEIEIDATLTYSDRERLMTMDFEQMSAEEMADAKSVIQRMRLPFMEVPTRRFRPVPEGPRIDMRTTLRRSMRGGGASIDLYAKTRRMRRPPLVVLCDISGSMSQYSRMLLHFLHALTNDRDRVHTFLFGTRLTNITRDLRHRDVDIALEKVSQSVEDWQGGTRIGSCLSAFNRVWSRRVLGQGAVVLMISDGLDRDAGDGLDQEMERLHKSCRRLVWLNPLLRYEGFAPKSSGVRAMLPHVDDFRSIHNLRSLADLADALDTMPTRRLESARHWRKELAA